MKKESAYPLMFGLILISLLLLLSSAYADENNSVNASGSSSLSQVQNLSKIQKGFECLKTKIGSDCSNAKTIQELALTILASPETKSKCIEILKQKKFSSDCWGEKSCSIRDTALAILALNSVGDNTNKAEAWLLNRTKISSDLIWYLEQDSDSASQCKISYSGKDYTVNAADNKKLDSSAGNCLTLAQSNFWLRVSPSCYETEFQVSCDKNFIATLLYKQQNSPTIYVLSGTESQPAFGTISLKIKAKCFSTSSACNYEDSAWAVLALLKTGHNIEDFVPYLIAMADSNKKYLPNSFIYMATNYENYGTLLIQEQRLGNYWQADSTAYNKFYDTALALLALRTDSEQVIKAKDWILFSQGSDGCWKNSNSEIIRDTAIILWAFGEGGGSANNAGVEYCASSNYFCIPTQDCPENEKLENYFCPGTSNICCMNEHLVSCSAKQGQICTSGKYCDGLEVRASDTDNCCLAKCVEQTLESECEAMGYICKGACSDNQEEISYACSSGMCCRTKTIPPSTWWIWLIIVLIVLIIAVLAFIFRDKLKLLWFKLKNKIKKEKLPPSPSMSGGFPPRPGFPPVRRFPPMPPQRQRAQDKGIDSVFRKLKEMSS